MWSNLCALVGTLTITFGVSLTGVHSNAFTSQKQQPKMTTLRTVIFLSSARTSAPMWGGDARLGDRVSNWVQAHLSERASKVGDEDVTHEVTVFDPIEVFGAGGALAHSGAQMSTPTFFTKDVPEGAKAMGEKIEQADAIICITAEYNHSVPPGLSGMLNHFGGSKFKCKPSGIITYSSSPWGGSRASIALQPILHELGSLPVSRMVHVPSVAELIKESGEWEQEDHRMKGQLAGMLDQLEWMAVAMKSQKEKSGVF
ncbi:hypothetical protein TL16_g01864 [Triparma laevis f. inornata]|uniref:NADPH-dependent FMN reductase-like domain-containing protein n=2 Tax=Triparma laevis TaxID=1534972 RepID=A0A9W6ZPE0_9STRA|nr:hypothetical protein TL16_g01864 [Triparma laevis f. inornata]GMH56766.1 hypothetical protein TrLO_g4292 [Triparma laevis f. longispina]